MTTAVFGTADTEEVARHIVDDLKSRGVVPENISALFPDRSGGGSFAALQGTKLPEGASTGAGLGGVLGGGLGWLVGVGSLAIPGLGPFIAAGPIMAALSGAAAGAALGGLTGALVGLGIPETEVKRYQEKLGAGSILLSVQAEDQTEADQIRQIFIRDGAHDVAVV